MKRALQFAVLFAGCVAASGAVCAQQAPSTNEKPVRVQAGKLAKNIVLASAESPKSNPEEAHAKRPAPRITTCRCGGPLPASDPNEQ